MNNPKSGGTSTAFFMPVTFKVISMIFRFVLPLSCVVFVCACLASSVADAQQVRCSGGVCSVVDDQPIQCSSGVCTPQPSQSSNFRSGPARLPSKPVESDVGLRSCVTNQRAWFRRSPRRLIEIPRYRVLRRVLRALR